MEDKEHLKNLPLRNLRILAKVVALIFVSGFSVFILIMSVMVNLGKRADLNDYLIVASGVIYILGLLTGLKWELLGAIISLGFLVAALSYFIYWDITGASHGFNIKIYAGTIVLLIPCLLYFLSWYFHRKSMDNHL